MRRRSQGKRRVDGPERDRSHRRLDSRTGVLALGVLQAAGLADVMAPIAGNEVAGGPASRCSPSASPSRGGAGSIWYELGSVWCKRTVDRHPRSATSASTAVSRRDPLRGKARLRGTGRYRRRIGLRRVDRRGLESGTRRYRGGALGALVGRSIRSLADDPVAVGGALVSANGAEEYSLANCVRCGGTVGHGGRSSVRTHKTLFEWH